MLSYQNDACLKAREPGKWRRNHVSDRERLMRSVAKEGSCWIWQLCRNPKGYGQLRRGERTVAAHRFSYETFIGTIPSGQYVCHRCDVPACCNPAHLFLGTQVENMRDCSSKGRLDHSGTKNGRAILNHSSVQEIRSRYSTGEFTQLALSREFGVSRSQISAIVSGSAWSGGVK